MSEFFKSAMGHYFNNGSGGGVNSTYSDTVQENEFCGQTVNIDGLKLRVKRTIAEGGFAFVYVAQDINSNTEYALKRLIGTDKQACDVIINEINTHKQLSGHPNIVTFVGASLIDKTNGPQQRVEYLLLTELCKGGSLIDCLSKPLEPQLVLRIFYQAVRAVSHMHSQIPQIIHRDIKIENFLLGNDNQLKLCDFGSITNETITPSIDWRAQQRNLLEDQLSYVTTPIYRPPEILDTWSNYEIGVKVDIWALGCILYVLCFLKHPFEDSAKLRIVNGNYNLPSDSRFQYFHDIIKGCLTVDPTQRFTISMILERLASISESLNWPLKGNLELNGKPIESPSEAFVNGINTSDASQKSSSRSTFYTDDPTVRPQTSNSNSTQTTASASASANNSTILSNNGSLFSSLRGGAGTFLKNLKDTSSKVMQTMQQTIARTELDISYITSRVLVMPCPSEGFESAYKTNNIDDVRLSIESRFSPQKVSVYNFGSRTCPRLPPPVRTVEVGTIYSCTHARSPNLEGIFSVAEDMFGFLKADPKSIIIIQTSDSGGCSAATMVCALLMYANLLREPEDAVQVFAVKRHPINLRPSEFRYLYYFGDILRPIPLLPHYKTLNLVSLLCQPVPRMTKARDGCRIYIEVFCNDRLMLTTLQDYEKLKLYLAGPGKISIPINTTVCGDLTVVLYHARNAMKGMVRPQGLKICQFQIHTGFVPEQETLISFTTNDLDDLPDVEQVPQDFHVSLSLNVTNNECPPTRNPPWVPLKPLRNCYNLFSSKLEYEEMVDNFVSKPNSNQETIEPTWSRKREPPSVIPKATTNTLLILPDVTEISNETSEPTPEPTPPIDLLNLNQTSPDGEPDTYETMPKSDASYDLLGAFGDDNSTGIGSASIPDILANNSQTQSTGLDDIFGSLGGTEFNLDFTTFGSPLTSAHMEPNITHNVPTIGVSNYTSNVPVKENSPNQPKDPFADIANLASGLNINFDPNKLAGKSASTTPIGGTSPYGTQFSSPTHNTAQRIPTPQSTTTNHPSPSHVKSPNGGIEIPFTNANTSGNHSTSTSNNAQHQNLRPDYNRAHFEPSKSATGNAPPKNADIFADILGEQGYKFGSKTNHGPRSINEMRKEDLIKDMDPEKVKIMEWTEGKKSNIRALLCSMHTILWKDAKWSKCEMSTLITPTDVKKAYRRACLAAHPDKHNGTENEETAKLIFMELNNAWTDFENDSTQQNMFNT